MPKQLVCILEINEQEGHQFKTLILLMYFTCLFETPHHTEMNFENQEEIIGCNRVIQICEN